MKKSLIILLAVLAVLGCLTGCGKRSTGLHQSSVTQMWELSDEEYERAKASEEYLEEIKNDRQPTVIIFKDNNNCEEVFYK